jgi:hypothetical protein
MPRTVACGRVRRIRGLAGAITGAQPNAPVVALAGLGQAVTGSPSAVWASSVRELMSSFTNTLRR